MRSFWLWFSLLSISWVLALYHLTPQPFEDVWRLIWSACFFTFYFLSPIFRTNPLRFTCNLAVVSIVAVAALWPDSAGASNPYSLLVLSLLAGKAVYRLPLRYAAIIGAILIAGALAPLVAGLPSFPLAFILLYSLVLAMALAVFQRSWQRVQESEARNEALLSEYRKMKRRITTGEELARQEERAQIGRDIHDSVGHKLTALLMQLEVYRMKASDEAADHLQKLKQLAQDSLQETRSAVRALKENEAGGLQAIMRLIRKLEMENFIRIHFVVRDGAMSAPLSNDQSIAVYRAVQEALTNAMRHSRSREVEIVFEAPGGSVFRFEISNHTPKQVTIREGFGLQSMRERIEQQGGKLVIIATQDQFTLQGTLPIHSA